MKGSSAIFGLLVAATATAALHASGRTVTGPGAPSLATPPLADQDPCQSQLVADLEQCEDKFRHVIGPNIALKACIDGAERTQIKCLADAQKQAY